MEKLKAGGPSGRRIAKGEYDMAEIMEEKKELTPAETAVPAAPETPKEAEKAR